MGGASGYRAGMKNQSSKESSPSRSKSDRTSGLAVLLSSVRASGSALGRSSGLAVSSHETCPTGSSPRGTHAGSSGNSA